MPATPRKDPNSNTNSNTEDAIQEILQRVEEKLRRKLRLDGLTLGGLTLDEIEEQSRKIGTGGTALTQGLR